MSITVFGVGVKTQSNKTIHGGKGAGLIDMSNMGLPVPEGFILPTDYCNGYNDGTLTTKDINELLENVRDSILNLMSFNNKPLLLSVRSGARVSMPGMMDTILNIGMTEQTLSKWVKVLGETATYDSYCRLLYMMGESAYNLPKEHLSQKYLKLKGTVDYVSISESLTQYLLGQGVPTFWRDVNIQYRDSIIAVWNSWNSERAKTYRELHGYSDDWGTAVTIQRMVFGNLNDKSCSGVVFTRNPDTGEDKLYGEFLLNAQGEDVVSGAVTPEDITELQDAIPNVYGQLCDVAEELEFIKKDIQDIEFTVEDGELYILQTRDAKRSSTATFNAAYAMYIGNIITLEEAISRCKYSDYLNVSKVTVDYKKADKADVIGIPASSGVVSAKVTTDIDKVISSPNKYILVRKETTPDDLQGMIASKGIITLTGGATSHAAVVARGLGIPCIVGCTGITIDGLIVKSKDKELNNNTIKILMDGSTGNIWAYDWVPVTAGYNTSAEKLIKLVISKQLVFDYSKNIKKVTKKDYHKQYIHVGGDISEVSRLLPKLPKGIHVLIYLDSFTVGHKGLQDELLTIMDITPPDVEIKPILDDNQDKIDNVTFITFNGDMKATVDNCGFKVHECTDYIGGIVSATTKDVLINIEYLPPEDVTDVIKLASLAGINAYRFSDIQSKGTLIKETVFKT